MSLIIIIIKVIMLLIIMLLIVISYYVIKVIKCMCLNARCLFQLLAKEWLYLFKWCSEYFHNFISFKHCVIVFFNFPQGFFY